MVEKAFVFSSRRRHTRCALVTGVQAVLFRSEVVDADGGDARPGSALRRRGGSRHRRFRRGCGRGFRPSYRGFRGRGGLQVFLAGFGHGGDLLRVDAGEQRAVRRSEEHTSELQSLMRISYAVFCLKKKNNTTKLI